MQRGREVRENSSNNSGSAFDDFEGFGFSGSMFPSIFGGRDPFDDPFFTRPFGSMFGSSAFGSNSAHGESRHASASRSKGPIIEELDSDDERVVEDKGHDVNTDGDNEDKFKENAWSNRNPLVEHPEDQTRGNMRFSNFVGLVIKNIMKDTLISYHYLSGQTTGRARATAEKFLTEPTMAKQRDLNRRAGVLTSRG